MKAIYIPVSDRPECVVALHQGFTIGQQIGANIIGYHIRPHRDSTVKLPDESKSSVLGIPSFDAAWESALEEKASNEAHIKAKLLFDKMADQFNYTLSKKPKAKPAAFWTEKVGSPERLFSIMGPVSDLMMVSRPAKKGRSLANTIMLSSVLHSSSPVMILPQTMTKTLGKRIAIAWNQSAEASLALKAAMPLLQAAKAVNIITNGAENRLGPKASHLVNYLSYWGIEANHTKVKDNNDTNAILNGYQETKSDLLIMGGYSRSRLRQQIFGGVTQHMLHDANIPVFMLHS